MKYAIYIHKDENSDYGVTVPDLAGCFSAGGTFEDALEQAQEAILCHIEGLLIDGEKIATPSPMDSLVNNPQYTGGVWAVVDVDISQASGKAKRINITLPENLLHSIDRFAESRHETRSRLLATAAMEYMGKH